jgi:hypothetical protein
VSVSGEHPVVDFISDLAKAILENVGEQDGDDPILLSLDEQNRNAGGDVPWRVLIETGDPGQDFERTHRKPGTVERRCDFAELGAARLR